MAVVDGNQRRNRVNTTQINAVGSGSVRAIACDGARSAAGLRVGLRLGLRASNAQANAKTIAEQMKKARRNRQAFIKFGCGGRI